jgi:hypothetical protein
VVLRWSIYRTIPLQISRGKQVREERQRKRRAIGGRRRRGVHHRRRNRPGKPADLWVSIDEFRRIGSTSSEKEKRGGGGGAGLFISGLALQRGLGFAQGGGDRAARRDVVQGEEILPEEGDDMWVPGVSEGGEGEFVPVWGWGLLVCGLFQGLGRMVPPGPFSYFLFLSLFFF